MGEAPQLWVEIDERLPVIGTGKERVVDGELYSYLESADLRCDAKPAKEGDLGHPRGEIKRVDTEKLVPIQSNPTQCDPFPCFFMLGWTR